MALLSFSSSISSLSSAFPRFQFFRPKPKPPSTIIMKKKKKGPKLIKLVSSAGTGFFYIAEKTKRLQRKLLFKGSDDKFVVRKYDPRVRRHVLFIETKMK